MPDSQKRFPPISLTDDLLSKTGNIPGDLNVTGYSYVSGRLSSVLLGGLGTNAVNYYWKIQVTDAVLHRLTQPTSESATTTYNYTYRDSLGSRTERVGTLGVELSQMATDLWSTTA